MRWGIGRRGEGRKFDRIVQVSAVQSSNQDPDVKALLSKDEVIARGAKAFEKRAPRQPSSYLRRRVSRCDACNATSSDREILVSVYHHGQYCVDCLSVGLCESDPLYCSKWESIDWLC